MPDVMGKKLDVARSEIKRTGFEDDVDVLGGGVFGIIQEGSWEVCEQTPAAGKPLTNAPRLTVERNCRDDSSSNEPSPDPEATDSATRTVEPTPTPTPTSTPAPAAQAGAPTLADLEAYVAEDFGTATWFPSITGYKALGDGELEVTTSLDPAADASSQDAQAMCSATTDFFLVQEKEPLVRVTASNGQIFARRTALNDTCAA